MISPAKLVEANLTEETLEEKSKFIRFERLSELFTFVALIAVTFLTILPFQYSFDRATLYIFVFVVLSFSFFWFRLLPKKYSGKTKNLIYYVLSVIFVGFVVYFTQGITSPVIFLFYLTCLAIAASMGKRETLFITGFSALIIISLAFFETGDLPISQRLSLAIFHTWGLVITIVVGWFIFREEKKSVYSHQRAHIEKIKEISQAKDEFVFIISSKLANPIITLREYITMVLSGKFGELEDEQKEILIKTEDNSKRLELLVGDMLDLSKIETGVLKLNLGKVNIGELISETLADFALKAADKGISLLFNNPKMKILVSADSARLQEVVANLVDNAVKYSPKGSSVKISVKQKTDYVQVDVTDNGIGISTSGRKHLFEKFYRADSGKIEGSGLGLFISRQLIERQGGKIWCVSKLGEGSTFSFELPKIKDG